MIPPSQLIFLDHTILPSTLPHARHPPDLPLPLMQALVPLRAGRTCLPRRAAGPTPLHGHRGPLSWIGLLVLSSDLLAACPQSLVVSPAHAPPGSHSRHPIILPHSRLAPPLWCPPLPSTSPHRLIFASTAPAHRLGMLQAKTITPLNASRSLFSRISDHALPLSLWAIVTVRTRSPGATLALLPARLIALPFLSAQPQHAASPFTRRHDPH
ncbi:MAG: hypothetical protein H0U76_25450 [Ktedonobacteraceae bacterium]|nr:hypothetical protein [Ktedonobacteraceae bacterium]